MTALAVASAAAYAISARFGLIEHFVDYSRGHQNWRLDDVALIVVLGAVASSIFAARRSQDMFREVKSRKAAELQIRTLAMHDPLTGLANRRKMHDHLRQALAARTNANEVTALLLIDLDRFKPINDTHGHGVGDRLLKAIADRLEDTVQGDELVARLGGDTFAVLLPRLPRLDAAGRPARRILQGMEAPFRIDQLMLHVGVSMGAAVTADPATDLESLIHHADVALYRAKHEGRGEFRYFEEHMDSEIRTRAKLELDFRQAVTDQAIMPFYHPLVELATGHIKGYELLARWIHPEMGIISPDLFIPIAEDSGLIGDMCFNLLRKACAEATAWTHDEIIALNISPLQLRDPQLPGKLMAVLHECGFPPHRLEVEITETALVGDLESARTILLALKGFGVRIALDDFGTGYSSLHHLRQLPLDLVKIDRSFVLSMSESEESRKIVDAIIALSHSLGLRTVAEGIESAAVLARLTALGCDFGQGFLYGEPNPSIAAFAGIGESARGQLKSDNDIRHRPPARFQRMRPAPVLAEAV